MLELGAVVKGYGTWRQDNASVLRDHDRLSVHFVFTGAFEWGSAPDENVEVGKTGPQIRLRILRE
jgi:hypothetical protein